MRQQQFGLDHLTLQATALFKMHQMRRAIDARFKARFRQDGFQHCAGRALAISPRHCDDRTRKAKRHAACDAAYPCKPHVDADGVNGFAVL